jgi:hypothetical protein
MKIMRILARCSGSLCMELIDTDKNNCPQYEYYGYVPFNIGIGGNDEVELDIDMETGQILNWSPLTIEEAKHRAEEE